MHIFQAATVNTFEGMCVYNNMKRLASISHLVIASLFVLLGEGYVCGPGGGSGTSRGDITFRWSFSQRQCALVSGVTNVAIVIPNQTLENQGVYNCNNAGSDGIKLLNFRPGQYTYTIFGRDQAGTILYQNSGSFAVDGDTEVRVDLAPSTTAPGSALVTYQFPPNGTFSNPNCQQAGVASVFLKVDDLQGQQFRCEDGFAGQGIQLPTLAPGRHTIDVAAAGSDGIYYYRTLSNLDISPGVTVSAGYTLAWAVGTPALRWALSDGTLLRTCLEAGASKVAINFRDATGQYRFQGAGAEVDCNYNNTSGYSALAGQLPSIYLYPGTYGVYLQASGTTGRYASNQVNVPTVTIQAGNFAALDPTTQVINMTRQP